MIILPNTLKIFLVISIFIFILHVFNNVKKNKLSVRNCIVWLENLKYLANLLGIETVSNFIFFLGFIFLIFVVFDLTRIVSTQNKKIITLTQELGILKKEIENDKEK